MSDGFDVRAEDLESFGKQLDDLGAGLREIGSTVGACFMDVGLFGLVGQAFGAGASHHCREVERQLGKYADDVVGDLRERLNKTIEQYKAGDEESMDSFLRIEL